MLSTIIGAPLIVFSSNIEAASRIVFSGDNVIKLLVPISLTVFLGILLIVLVSTSKILSVSSRPTILPITPRLFTGVGPIFIVSPIFKVLIFPKILIAASHSAGCGTLVNSILATDKPSNFSLSTYIGTLESLSDTGIFKL